MSKKLRLEVDVHTHQGCVRAVNEDSLTASARNQVWAIADGMGGHKNGQFASQQLASSIEAAVIPDDLDGACQALADAIYVANDFVFAEAQKAGQQMGSTVVALVIRGDSFAVLWAGDSRAYLLRDDVLHQLTKDHTQVQEMLDRGLLSEKEAADHPMSHVLARAVGVQADLEIDAISDTALVGDTFLLCSDGLHGVLGETEIIEIIEKWGRESAAKLVEACIENGAPDNVSVAIVRTFEPTTLASAGNQELIK
jgi:serine/threonine protein phosphatase Stp1